MDSQSGIDAESPCTCTQWYWPRLITTTNNDLTRDAAIASKAAAAAGRLLQILGSVENILSRHIRTGKGGELREGEGILGHHQY